MTLTSASSSLAQEVIQLAILITFAVVAIILVVLFVIVRVIFVVPVLVIRIMKIQVREVQVALLMALPIVILKIMIVILRSLLHQTPRKAMPLSMLEGRQGGAGRKRSSTRSSSLVTCLVSRTLWRSRNVF